MAVKVEEQVEEAADPVRRPLPLLRNAESRRMVRKEKRRPGTDPSTKMSM